MRLSARLKTVLLVLGVYVALIIVGTLFPEPSGGERTKRAQARVETAQLATALTAYHTEYSRPLEGELPHILTTLAGDNPRKIVFMELNPKSLNAKGEFVDPWGTPYKLVRMPNERLPKLVGIDSFGKNKKDEQGAKGSDDIVSWR